MLCGAKNDCVRIDDDRMDYIVFGRGEKTLIIIPGIGDGLKTVRGMALPFSVMYRKFAKEFRVYVFSVRRGLPEAYTTKDMARDLVCAMDQLGIGCADVIGVSMGGMIAQRVAIDFPQRVGKLVLAVTSARRNDILSDAISAWLRYTKMNDHQALMLDSAKRMYTNAYLKKYRGIIRITAMLSRPRSYDRFESMARACVNHDTYEELERITSRTLVIGGRKDEVLGVVASQEIAERILDSELKIYEEYGHALYEEAEGFNDEIYHFLVNAEGRDQKCDCRVKQKEK